MTTCFQTVYTNKLGQANLIEIEAVDDNSVFPTRCITRLL